MLRFGSKAETLDSLKNLVTQSRVLDSFYFPASDWEGRKEGITEAVTGKFSSTQVIVRSSCHSEDQANNSNAGMYKSVTDVDLSDRREFEEAVENVISSYEGDPRDQVLIQPMIKSVRISGVVMTRGFEDGSPYYVINYDDESGKTDRITGGIGVNKTVFIYRDFHESHIKSWRMKRIIQMARELESLAGDLPLDIEFGMLRSGEIYVFQVRRMSMWGNWRADIMAEAAERLPHIEQYVLELSQPKSGVSGDRTILGTMPDWNPAEIIGTTPNALAASLYRSIITKDIWSEARSRMGYQNSGAEELMVLICGRPYIDVRASFNSFLPEGLDEDLSTKLVNAWLSKLEGQPELHDKVEFEVAQTCFDFAFKEVFEERYGNLFSWESYDKYETLIRTITINALDIRPEGSLGQALGAVSKLESLQASRPLPHGGDLSGQDAVRIARRLIDECRLLGTLPFAVIARHAFIAEALLRSAVRKGAISRARAGAFKRSIRTVSSKFAEEFREICLGRKSQEEFLERYGHLRPGTYDVKSLRYVDRDDMFASFLVPGEIHHADGFVLEEKERSAISALMKENRLEPVTVDGLLEYIRKSVWGREHAKFCFTRNLSDALEWLVLWGESIGLGREELANLEIDEIFDTLAKPLMKDAKHHFLEIAEARKKEHAIACIIRLGFLIRNVADLYVVPVHRNMPNFVGEKHIHGPVVLIDAESTTEKPLYNHIVVLENADPGFDWIFSQGITGMITKYGGANSHMAIRCSEFGLPAAIGCGEQLFGRIVKAGSADLNCREKILKPVYEH